MSIAYIVHIIYSQVECKCYVNNSDTNYLGNQDKIQERVQYRCRLCLEYLFICSPFYLTMVICLLVETCLFLQKTLQQLNSKFSSNNNIYY